MGSMMGGGVNLVDHGEGEVGTGDGGLTLLVKQCDLVPDWYAPVRSPAAQAPYEPAGLTNSQSRSLAVSSTNMARVASPSSASSRNCSGISPSANRGAPGAGRSELKPPIWKYLAPAPAHSPASSR